MLKVLHQGENRFMSKIQLSIPIPCHEDWGKMTPAEKGKFCLSCQKVVVDFSRMSDADMVAYFKKPKESVCGRFNTDQLNRNIIVPAKRIPWLKYFFQIAIPAFLMSFKAASQTKQMQGKVISKVTLSGDSTTFDKRPSKPNMGEALEGLVGGVVVQKGNKEKFITITGKITDENGLPIPSASVCIKGTKVGTLADSIGNFSIRISEQKVALLITAVGFNGTEIQVDGRDSVSAVLVSMNPMLMGEIVVVKHTKKTKKNQAPDTKQIKLLESKEIGIYPNPASSGSVVNIDWKEAEEGSYEIQLISEAGIVINKIETEVITKSLKTNIQLPWLANGMYIVSILNKKTKAQHNIKLLIN